MTAEGATEQASADPRPGRAIQRSSIVELVAGVAGVDGFGRGPGNLIVDDGQVANDGQMHKSEFMVRVREAACAAADAELRRAGHSTDGCPYVERWLSFYEGRSAAHLERAVRRYATSGGAVRAADYIPGIRDRVGHAAAQWVLHGTIPDDLMADAASSYGEPSGAAGEAGDANGAGSPGGTGVARKAVGPATAAGMTGPQLAAQLGPGKPLGSDVRGRMEGVLGHSLARVRIHDDPRAAAMAHDVGARAFTFGDHVAMGRDQPSAGTIEGDALLAHELAHVAQQQGAPAPAGPLPIDDSSALEHEADDVALAAIENLHGGGHRTARPAARGALRLSRCKTEQQRMQEQAAALIPEMQRLIAGADWRTGVRPRRYPAESAEGIRHARLRHEGRETDWTGLGSLVRLEHFATAVRDLQTRWNRGVVSAATRTGWIATLANAELTAVDVPAFLRVDHEDMQFMGGFEHRGWRFVIANHLINDDHLDDADAGELANTIAHESRHAEQTFLSARFEASQNPRITIEQLANRVRIPNAIATTAIARRFNARTPAAVRDLGSRMHQAGVVEGDRNQAISDNDGMREMDQARTEAQTALSALQTTVDARTLAAAVAKRDALQRAIATVERLYTDYRNIPYESDAHQVGDAAELAFRGWR